MRPSATYRLQLHHQFTFKQVQGILDYLDQLGISTIYASPIFASVPGSMHGYDVINPHLINPEIGTEMQLEEISRSLRQKNMNWLQDIVPNHMAFDNRNEWLADVLERGEASPYSDFFDIDWTHSDRELHGKLIVPFLGESLQHCLEKKEIHLFFEGKGFQIKYHEQSWPVSVSAFGLLWPTPVESSKLSGKGSTEHLIEQFEELKERAVSGINRREWITAKEGWLTDVTNRPEIMKIIQENVDHINQEEGLLKEILDSQYYVLTYWKTTEKKINYRRFFTVNGLICLRMENEKVYNEYHDYIISLYKKGLIQGLRIDHIDGLYDPKIYFDELRNSVGEDCYIIAEKILTAQEELPNDWNAEGTSGYEFLSHISRLLTNVRGANGLVTYYKKNIGNNESYEDIVFQNKFFILRTFMKGELENLKNYLHELKLWPGERTTDTQLLEALAAFMAAFPIYRIYPDAFPLDQIQFANQALQKALQKRPGLQRELRWVRSLFESKRGSLPEISAELLFLKRLMQFTGPLAAKGVEDTAFYFYNPLISHNEVGDAPEKLAINSRTFHRQMMNRLKKSPHSLNATSTHDTKRGEDARIRINVLSEMYQEWIEAVEEWTALNLDLKKSVNGKLVPAVNEEYFIYQSMIGGFPPGLMMTEEDISRLKEYIQKFLREEKLYTDWSDPDLEYEEACADFIDALFNNRKGFLYSFTRFVEKVIGYASIYSLCQVLIKTTAPGIPDVYQGTELWDLSYVDPDNRRPVDYKTRMTCLELIKSKENDPEQLLYFLANNRQEGIEKMYVLYRALNLRKENPELFLHGDYIPIEIEDGDHIALAYARHWNNQWVIVVVPLDIVEKMDPEDRLPDESVWKGNFLTLPQNAPLLWKNEFNGKQFTADTKLNLSEIFREFPVALISSQ